MSISNNKKNNVNGKDGSAERASILLDGIMKHDLPDHIKDRLRGWFKSGVSEERKYAALELIFNELKGNASPDENDYRGLEAIHAILGFPVSRNTLVKRKNPIHRLQYFASRAAAVLAITMLGGGVYLWFNGESKQVPILEQEITYTPIESKHTISEKITLPDGSTVLLDKTGRIEIADDFEMHRCVKVSGEAFFSVRHKDGQNFKVEADGIVVTVLGTEFLIKAHAHETSTEVKLSEGKICVTAIGVEGETMMAPGDRLVYHKEHRTIELHEIGEDEMMAMRGMNLRFNHSLNNIFDTLSKRYHRIMQVRNGIDLDREVVVPFDGTESVEEVMYVLKTVTGDMFEYEISEDTITITKPD